MALFVRSVTVRAPVEIVFAFHQRGDALRLLSPAFPPLRVVRRSGGIETGAVVELMIGPIRWTALHTAYEKNLLFVDRQIRGPFSEWEHRHEFEARGAETLLTDRVHYRLPGGAAAHALLGWAVHLALDRMFRYRHAATKQWCEHAAHSP